MGSRTNSSTSAPTLGRLWDSSRDCPCLPGASQSVGPERGAPAPKGAGNQGEGGASIPVPHPPFPTLEGGTSAGTFLQGRRFWEIRGSCRAGLTPGTPFPSPLHPPPSTGPNPALHPQTLRSPSTLPLLSISGHTGPPSHPYFSSSLRPAHRPHLILLKLSHHTPFFGLRPCPASFH